jgi:hypothetical protein
VAESGWREPASLRPPRWGGYRSRYGTGLSLLLAGGLLVQSGSVYAPQLMLVGMSAHLIGWWLVPGRGWRRIIVSVLSLTTVMLILNGAAAMVFLVVPLAGWLWLRQRPALSYLVLVFPVLNSYVLSLFFAQYGHGALVLTVSGLVLAASAWLARFIAKRMPHRGDSPASIG